MPFEFIIFFVGNFPDYRKPLEIEKKSTLVRNSKFSKLKKTHREKIEGGHWFPCRGLKYFDAPNLSCALAQPAGVEKLQWWKQEVLLNVVDGVVCVMPRWAKLMAWKLTIFRIL